MVSIVFRDQLIKSMIFSLESRVERVSQDRFSRDERSKAGKIRGGKGETKNERQTTKRVCTSYTDFNIHYSRMDLLDIGFQQKMTICSNFHHTHNIPDEIARPAGSPWIVIGSGKRHRRRCERKQKRGCRAGRKAKLKKQTLKPPLPTDDLELQLAGNRYVRECCTLIITETWLHAQIPDASVQLAGRMLHRWDRNSDSGKNRGGGICIYVHEVTCCGSADLLVATHRYSKNEGRKSAEFLGNSDDVISLTDTTKTKKNSDSWVHSPPVSAPITSEASLPSLSRQFSRTADAWLHQPLKETKFEPWISFEDMEAYQTESNWPYFPWQIQPPSDTPEVSSMWGDLERFKTERQLPSTEKKRV